MLILGRKQGEVIVIGDDITIKILSISKGSVRIGIEAPMKVPVFRKELLDARSRETDSGATE